MSQLMREKWTINGNHVYGEGTYVGYPGYVDAQELHKEVSVIIAERNWLALVAMAAMNRWRLARVVTSARADEFYELECYEDDKRRKIEWSGTLADGHANTPNLAAALRVELPK